MSLPATGPESASKRAAIERWHADIVMMSGNDQSARIEFEIAPNPADDQQGGVFAARYLKWYAKLTAIAAGVDHQSRDEPGQY
jgi:hypothetical protein